MNTSDSNVICFAIFVSLNGEFDIKLLHNLYNKSDIKIYRQKIKVENKWTIIPQVCVIETNKNKLLENVLNCINNNCDIYSTYFKNHNIQFILQRMVQKNLLINY